MANFLSKHQGFINVLIRIQKDLQEITQRPVKLEPAISCPCVVDSQSYEYRMSDSANSLRKKYSTLGETEFTLPSGSLFKINEFGSLECEYQADNCPIEKIVAQITELDEEIELYMLIVFKDDIPSNFTLAESEFNRLM